MRLGKGPRRRTGRHPYGDRTGRCCEADHARTYHGGPGPGQDRYVQAPAAPAPAPEPAYFTNSTAVVQQFYQDINNGNYSEAWALGGDNIGGSDYAGWVAGYDTTVSVSLGTFSAFGSDQVQASLSALQSDGSTNTYEGTYTVSGGVIVAASIVQTGG